VGGVAAIFVGLSYLLQWIGYAPTTAELTNEASNRIVFSLIGSAAGLLLVGAIGEYTGVKRGVLLPGWGQLNKWGNDQLKRVSYIVLGVVPVVAYAFHLKLFAGTFLADVGLPLNMKYSFFASFFIVMGSAIAMASSPLPPSGASGLLEDIDPDRRYIFRRLMCLLCYVCAFILGAMVAFRAAAIVSTA
jgi:hypothetical protein